MNNLPSIIKGGAHADQRGKLTFVNDFIMDQVKRFYVIEHPNTDVIRAWRGHRIEQRWFCAMQGTFEIRLVKIDNWESPTKNLPVSEFVLSTDHPEVLHIPAGFASWIKAREENSKLLIFADYNIENAKNDDFLYPTDHFEL